MLIAWFGFRCDFFRKRSTRFLLNIFKSEYINYYTRILLSGVGIGRNNNNMGYICISTKNLFIHFSRCNVSIFMNI